VYVIQYKLFILCCKCNTSLARNSNMGIIIMRITLSCSDSFGGIIGLCCHKCHWSCIGNAHSQHSVIAKKTDSTMRSSSSGQTMNCCVILRTINYSVKPFDYQTTYYTHYYHHPQHYNLRHRAHSLQLPEHTTQLSDSNFLARMLYKNTY